MSGDVKLSEFQKDIGATMARQALASIGEAAVPLVVGQKSEVIPLTRPGDDAFNEKAVDELLSAEEFVEAEKKLLGEHWDDYNDAVRDILTDTGRALPDGATIGAAAAIGAENASKAAARAALVIALTKKGEAYFKAAAAVRKSGQKKAPKKVVNHNTQNNLNLGGVSEPTKPTITLSAEDFPPATAR